jgi:hypothetical protein
LGFCPNPADFKYYRFYEVYHPELASLRGLNFADEEQDRAAFAWVEKHLEEVVAKSVEEGGLPLGIGRKWFGLGSILPMIGLTRHGRFEWGKGRGKA